MAKIFGLPVVRIPSFDKFEKDIEMDKRQRKIEELEEIVQGLREQMAMLNFEVVSEYAFAGGCATLCFNGGVEISDTFGEMKFFLTAEEASGLFLWYGGSVEVNLLVLFSEYDLTDKEIETANLLARGYSAVEVAEELGVTRQAINLRMQGFTRKTKIPARDIVKVVMKELLDE